MELFLELVTVVDLFGSILDQCRKALVSLQSIRRFFTEFATTTASSAKSRSCRLSL